MRYENSVRKVIGIINIFIKIHSFPVCDLSTIVL